MEDLGRRESTQKEIQIRERGPAHLLGVEEQTLKAPGLLFILHNISACSSDRMQLSACPSSPQLAISLFQGHLDVRGQLTLLLLKVY